jgi:uncharacterized membrane protein
MRRWLSWSSLSLTLAVLGSAVAAYLSVVHYNRGALVCGVGDCHTVQSSAFAELAGVPVALLGLGLFLSLVALGLLRRRGTNQATPTIAAFAVALAGTIYSGYLTYLEVAVIGAVCQWCVISALCTFGVLVAEGVGVARVVAEPV